MKMLQKLTIVGVFSLLALAIAPPPSQAQTAITFSGLADGTLVTTQYQNLGLTFSSTDPGGPQARITGGAIPGPDYLCPGVKGSSDQFNGTIVVLFSAPVNSFGSSIADGPTTLMGFAANGQKQTVSYAGGQKHATLNLDPGFEIVKATFTGTFYCLDFISFKGGFRILQPKDATQVSLTQTSFTETSPVSFEAGPIAPSATVKWTARLEYATSGRLGGFTDSRPFTTDATTHVHDETYTGIGGKITVDASQDTPAVAATPVTIYVVGTAIPDIDVTGRLINLYGGATQNLITGIAVRESSYKQFATRSLFGISALWPTESHTTSLSPHSGSHIGLMQMPVSQANAWDWLANTSSGVSLFNDKLASAGRLTSRIISSHPGLRQLTAIELEHMALVLYGPYASGSLSQQYYAPKRTSSGGWDWAINTAGNWNGIAYADSIFSGRR